MKTVLTKKQTNNSGIKSSILKAIEESGKVIRTEDFKWLQEEFISSIDEYISCSSGQVYHSIGANHAGTGQSDAGTADINMRYVIIGDLHCDFEALKGIILKLSLDEYDYFNKAVFIFMGDYLDRGFRPYQTLRLLFRIKQIMGPRCIILKGNHDGFYYKRSRGIFYPSVYPADTIERMFIDLEPATMEKIKTFFDLLPYFAFLSVKDKRYFITLGGIPKDCYKDQIKTQDFELT